jgi:hypothetical protein
MRRETQTSGDVLLLVLLFISTNSLCAICQHARFMTRTGPGVKDSASTIKYSSKSALYSGSSDSLLVSMVCSSTSARQMDSTICKH